VAHSSVLFLGAFAKLGKATVSFIMSVCLSAWSNSAPTGRNFMKFDIHEIHKAGKCGRTRHDTEVNIIRRMRFECSIPKAINTHLEYVMLTACPQQQLRSERASMLRYTHIACLVSFNGRI